VSDFIIVLLAIGAAATLPALMLLTPDQPELVVEPSTLMALSHLGEMLEELVR
jgi:hypothetical protein